MRKIRRIIAGLGALLIGAAITLGSMNWTQWVHDHTAMSAQLAIALVVGATACFVFWFFTNDPLDALVPSLPQAPAAATASVAGDVNQTNEGPRYGDYKPEAPRSESSSTGNIQTVNLYAYHPPEKLSAKEAGNEDEPIALLKLGFARGTVSSTGSHFIFDKDGKRALLIQVSNLPAPQGETAPEGRSLIATLKFTKLYNSVTTLQRAFWIGKDGNQTDIEPGDHEFALVGIPGESKWELFSNPNPYSAATMEWNAPREEIEEIDFS